MHLIDLPEFKRLLTAAPTHTLEKARELATKGKPWNILLSSTQDGSYKFWKAEGHAHVILPPDNLTLPPVKISWGRIGTPGRSAEKNWAYVEKAVPVKLRKGYTYGMPEPGNAPQDEAKKAAKGLLKAMGETKKSVVSALGLFEKQVNRVGQDHGLNVSPLQKAVANAKKVIPREIEKVEKGIQKELSALGKTAAMTDYLPPVMLVKWLKGLLQKPVNPDAHRAVKELFKAEESIEKTVGTFEHLFWEYTKPLDDLGLLPDSPLFEHPLLDAMEPVYSLGNYGSREPRVAEALDRMANEIYRLEREAKFGDKRAGV